MYQVYARQSAEEVHRLLRSVGADYIVLEDSICYERRHSRGCRLRDLLDLANGHVGQPPPHPPAHVHTVLASATVFPKAVGFTQEPCVLL